MKKSLFVLFLYSSLLTASEIAYRFVFGIEGLPAAKIAETFALIFVIAALYLFARYKASRLLIALFFALSIIANNVHYAVYQSWMTGINYWLMLKEVTEADFWTFIQYDAGTRYFAQTDIQPRQSQLFQLRLFCRARIAVSIV